MSRSDLHRALLAGASLAALLVAPNAFAQDAAPEVAGLEEVVVTATRQADTVNRVPLSVAAVTQQTLDQQGIKQAADITRLVPGLNISQTAGTNAVGNFSIRGIVGGTGAATVGVFLDETSLTKRSNNGVNQNNGAPLPILFDLERVEVLKGPQGTLFGGSSQGGTVRFITPNPSLTTYSGSLRLEGRKVKMGEEGYEFGAAVGGPIVQDKLGFRISAIRRNNPGFIDEYAPYGPASTTNVNSGGVVPGIGGAAGYGGVTNGANIAAPGTTLRRKDANSVVENAIRGALLWQINDRASAMLSVYASKTRNEGGANAPTSVYSKRADGSLADANEQFITNPVNVDINTRDRAGVPGNLRGRPAAATPIVNFDPTAPGGLYDGVVGQAKAGTAILPVGCSVPFQGGPAGIPTTSPQCFNRPSYVYGPFPQGRDIAYSATDQDIIPTTSQLDVQTLTLNYDFDNVNVKSITSFVHDMTTSTSAGGEDQTQQQSLVGGPVFGAALNTGNPAGAVRGFGLWAPRPNYPGLFTAYSKRNGIAQELRFSSRSDQRPLTWVAGVFYQNTNIHQLYYYADRGLNVSELGFFGVNLEQRYGIQNICNCNTFLEANIGDDEIAAYGEANYWITDKLRVTGGIRFSRIGFDFAQVNHGAFAARYPNNPASYVEGNTSNSPTTPKIGLTYEFTPNDLVYVTAAKGFRAGGANSPVTQSVCQVALDAFGINSTDVPSSFAPDTVWSYEAGGKFRLLNNRLQLNGAVYRIDWTGVQATIALSCGLSFVINGGKARSEGVDFQAQYRPIDPLTLGLNVGYTNAKYIDAVAGPRGPGIGQNSINAGDHFNIPKWQVSASAQWNFNISKFDAYVRGDYQWQSSYTGLGSFGVAAYNPFTRKAEAVDQLNARFGVNFTDQLEINIFSFNLLDSKDKLAGANPSAGNGKSACTTAGGVNCTQYTTFNPLVNQAYQRPREIGIQANYRF